MRYATVVAALSRVCGVLLFAAMTSIVASARADYRSAAAAYEKASKLPGGGERERAFLGAAKLYQEAVAKARDAPEAAEGTLLAVHAFKEAREIGEAIFMLEVFANEQGSESRLARLEKGDAKASPPRPPDPVEYKLRVRQLESALEDLSNAYVVLFDYASALRVYASTAANDRLRSEARRRAAYNAVMLHAAFGDWSAAKASRDLGAKLGEAAQTLATLDAVLTARDVRAWELAALRGEDPKRAAAAAVRSLRAYADRYKAQKESTHFVAEAAVEAATISFKANLPDQASQCKKARDALDRFATSQQFALAPRRLEEDLKAACGPARPQRALVPVGRYVRAGVDASLPPPRLAVAE